jgi:plastocyanin
MNENTTSKKVMVGLMLALAMALGGACDDDDDDGGSVADAGTRADSSTSRDGAAGDATGNRDAAVATDGASTGTDGGTSGADAATTGTDGASSTLLITIQNFMFSPANLNVPRGATVTVRNLDSVGHSVTSESMPNAFTPGGVAGVMFDTGIFSSGDRTFTVPATAPAGTVVPYYCVPHGAAMGNAQITIQ